MRLSFRQGILRHEVNAAPPLLGWTSLAHDAVDLQVVDSPASVTFAHYSANYIVDETRYVTAAWSGFPPNTTVYLYWDIDLATGVLTRHWTSVPWISTSVEPSNPVPDLHWFDNASTRMRVFQKPDPARPGYWIDKIRVFAGWIDQSAIIHQYDPGSQVGITGTFAGGHIIFGQNNVPLRQQDNTFATTGTNLQIQYTSGQNVQFDAALIFAKAFEEIPEYHLVSFLPYKQIRLASNISTDTTVSGILTQNLAVEEVGQVVTNGIVRNEQWNFSIDQINKPLFCGVTGQILTTPPTVGVVQQIGRVYDTDAIYIHLYPPVRLR